MPETDVDLMQIITVRKNATAREAATKMLTHKVGCLVVNDEDGRFAGIVTERDIVSRAVACSRNFDKTTVKQIMTKQIVFCSPDTPTNEARELMKVNHMRHLPVVDSEVVVGMVSARDLMEQQLNENRAAAEEVAMLSNCLKSIDLKEVADISTREASKLFQACRSVLYFQDCGNPTLVSFNECLCPQEFLKDLDGDSNISDDSGYYHDRIPEICERCGVKGPRLVIALNIDGVKDSVTGKDKPWSGCLCVCGLADSSGANKDLISYKAKLAKEILKSHLTNARHYEEARITALTDTLTQVGSRKLLEDKLEIECARAKRYKRPFSLAIVDLDNFKAINDVCGHAIGDDVLKRFATCMKSQKRIPDVLARYGGDEFVVLMPETRAEDAVSLLERIRIGAQKIKLGGNLPLTISCGIAEGLPDGSDLAREVIRRADRALYEAKRAGKNCIKIWDEDMAVHQKMIDIEGEKVKKLQRRIIGLSEKAERMFIQSIWALVQALEAKDPYTKKHSEHVMHYAIGIAETMGITAKERAVIRNAAMIHDIGKIGIADVILSKPGRLTPRECSIVKQHPCIAVRILERMTFLQEEAAIVLHHHERWDGRGYPEGLSKTSIPLGARIIAVADTFDALTSPRSYHRLLSVQEAIEVLTDSSGRQFASDVVEAMINWVEKTCQQLATTLDQLKLKDLPAVHSGQAGLLEPHVHRGKSVLL